MVGRKSVGFNRDAEMDLDTVGLVQPEDCGKRPDDRKTRYLLLLNGKTTLRHNFFVTLYH